MVSLVTALENGTCEQCGCTPCDCKQTDGLFPRSYNTGEIFELRTPKEKKMDSIAALILSRKQPLPTELHNASAQQVRAFLKGGKYQRV